jgi:transposase InsO family protein
LKIGVNCWFLSFIYINRQNFKTKTFYYIHVACALYSIAMMWYMDEPTDVTLARWREAYLLKQRERSNRRRADPAYVEKLKEVNKKYYEANKDKIAAKRREKYQNDPKFREAILSYQRYRKIADVEQSISI